MVHTVKLSLVLAAALTVIASLVHAQTVIQSGPTTTGHVPQYLSQGTSQPFVKDGGGSAGGVPTANPNEFGITSGPNMNVLNPPYASNGNGPFYTHFCMYDAPTNSAVGYHFLCLDPNAQGGGLLAYSAGGGAPQLPFQFNINGVPVNLFEPSNNGVGLVNLLQWGTLTQLETDVGPYIQQAYNANAGCIFIPPGNYNWNTAVTFAAQQPCFQGSGWNENVTGTPPGLGTWIHISNTSLHPVTITTLTGQGGTGGFSNMAFYEDQPASSSGWAPNSYQYIFTANANLGRVDFNNLMFFNVTHCISLYRSARHHITNIYGQPEGTCLTFDDQTDVGTLENVELWPFWTTDTNILTYQQTVDPIVYGRVDSPYGNNIFTLGYHSTLAFTQTASGVTTGAQFGAIESDVTKYGLWIEPGTSNVQFQVANFRGAGGTLTGTPTTALVGSECYHDDGSGTVVSIGNFDCFLSGSNGIHLTGTGAFQYANALIWAYNYDNNGSVGINAGTSGYVFGANQPSVVNPQNGATVIPPSGTGARYAVRGIRQYWTPTLVGTTTTGTQTYTANVGTYWYDGSQMDLSFYISATGISGFVGNLAIQGLPGTPNGATNQNTSCVISQNAGFTLGSGYTTVGAENVPATPAQFLMLESGGAVNTQPLPVSTMASSIVLQGQCTMAIGQ